MRPTSSVQPLLRSTDLLADLAVLENAYRTLHPGLLRYNTPAELSESFAQARHEFERDRSLGEAFIVLTRLTAAIRCGHSHPNPFNQTKEVETALFAAPRLPFLFRWIGNQMVITRNLSDRAELMPGAIVNSIAGVKTADLLAALMPLARADGHNDTKRRDFLSDRGDSIYEPFDILAPLLFPQLAGSTVTVELRAGLRAGSITVPMQTFDDRSALVRASGRDPKPSDPLWHLQAIERGASSVEYLAMPTWVAYKTTWDWKGNIQAIFEHLVDEGAPALIVDLRGNEGGSEVGDELLAHLIDLPLERDAFSRRVRFRAVPAPLRPVLDTWDPSFFTLGESARALQDGSFELQGESADDTIAPRQPRYRGKVIVLVDAANSSATFQFALAVQRQKLGTLVGEPTGGSQRGINGGAFFFVRLPHSRLEVDLPLIGTFPDTPAPDSGVTPDIVVPITASDLAAKLDTQLQTAFAVAARQR